MPLEPEFRINSFEKTRGDQGTSGGGLVLGLIQSLAPLPAAGIDRLTFDHFANVLSDPDFLNSLMILAVLRHMGSELLEVGRTLKAGPWQ